MGSKSLWKQSLATTRFSAASHSCKSEHSASTLGQELHQERHDRVTASFPESADSGDECCPGGRRPVPASVSRESSTSSDHGIQSQS